MLTFLSIVFAVYIMLVIVLAFGWARSMEDQTSQSAPDRKIAVVVPFRNEAANLQQLVRDLKAIRYPGDKVEYILVDDHSEDTSHSLVINGTAGDPRFKLLGLNANALGKKAAITMAINNTDADIIVTTDADCRVQDNWIRSINNSFSNPGVKMVVGPVRLTDTNFFEQLQALEFSSLVGTAGATLSFGVASMCNGANLAFTRESFLEVSGYAANDNISSGDDDFLMKKYSKRWKKSIHFLKSADGVVVARASATVPGFFSQRLRWAGKWRPDLSSSSMIALAVLTFHACNILLFGGWLLGTIPTKAFMVLALSKLFAELIFLLPVCGYLKLRWRWTSFIVLQLLYSFYVVSVGVLSQVLTTRWRGREVITRVWTGIS